MVGYCRGRNRTRAPSLDEVRMGFWLILNVKPRERVIRLRRLRKDLTSKDKVGNSALPRSIRKRIRSVSARGSSLARQWVFHPRWSRFY